MASQEDTKSSPPPGPPTAGTTHLASKFQRKAKFRRASISQSQSDTEYIPGLSNPPPGVDENASGKETLAEPPTSVSAPEPAPEPEPAQVPADSESASGGILASEEPPPAVNVKAEVASENGMSEDHIMESAVAAQSRSRSPKLEMATPVLSPDTSRRATSPPESARLDDTAESIASSPRGSMSPEENIKPHPGISPESDMRPFSPEELNEAKSLVLDLLGWGVEPEFLVTSGVSAEAIYRIFTDLNLRLPNNLEVSEDVKAMAYSWGPIPRAASDSNLKEKPPQPQLQSVD